MSNPYLGGLSERDSSEHIDNIFLVSYNLPKGKHSVSDRVTGRKSRGPQVEEIGSKCQMFSLSLSLKQQEKTNYKCQIFPPLLYTKLKGSFF